MTISDGTETKSITLYPPSRPRLEAETPLWVELEEEDCFSVIVNDREILKLQR